MNAPLARTIALLKLNPVALLFTLLKRKPIAVLLLVSAAAGFANPVLALPAALAVFFFTTGYALFSLCKIELPLPAKIGASIVTSVLVSTHFAFAAATAFGFSPTLVSACVVGLSLLAFAIDFNKLRGELKLLACDRQVACLGLLAFLFVGAILLQSTWRPVAGGIVNGGWNWSDFFFHYSIGASIAAGNFPPQTPYFAGTPFAYHYFADLHSALVATAGGAWLRFVMVLAQAALALSLALIAFSAAEFFLRSRRAAGLAVILLLFGGGLGYLEFFDGLSHGSDALAMVGSRSFDNDWNSKVFKVPSVLGVGLLTHRATTVALPAFAAVLLLLALAFENRSPRKAVFAGFLTALLPPFQFFALPVAAIAAGLFLLHKLFESRRNARGVFKLGVAFAAPLALAIPFVLLPLAKAGSSGAVRLNWGWESGSYDLTSLAVFYGLNFGVPLFLALAGLAFSWLAGRQFSSKGRFPAASFTGRHFTSDPRFALAYRGSPATVPLASNRALFSGRLSIASLGNRLTSFFSRFSPQVVDGRFLWVLAAALFVVPNAVALTVIAWDTGKFFQFMWLPLCILAAAFLARLPKPVIVVAVAASVLSPLLLAGWFALGSPFALSDNDLQAASWMESNTTIKDVFVTDDFINQPTDVAGRLRLLTFAPYVSNTGYDPGPREKAVKEIYCSGEASKSASLMRQYGADFVIVRRGGECSGKAVSAFADSSLFSLAYSNSDMDIFRLAD